jgi:hypothetical protein
MRIGRHLQDFKGTWEQTNGSLKHLRSMS